MRAFFETRRRATRALLGLAATLTVAVFALWLLVNHSSWAGPLFANGLRRLIGAERVTRLEEYSYGAQDRWNRWRHRNEAPKARWAAPAPVESAEPVQPDAATIPIFRPSKVGPVSAKWFAPGDGEWIPVPDPRHPDKPALLYKTLLHPDINRSWADLFVAAISLEGTVLHARAGTGEPRADVGTPTVVRTGRIPQDDLPTLLAAFNGGFMAEHGHYGMRVDGVNLLKPRPKSCSIVGYTNDTV